MLWWLFVCCQIPVHIPPWNKLQSKVGGLLPPSPRRLWRPKTLPVVLWCKPKLAERKRSLCSRHSSSVWITAHQRFHLFGQDLHYRRTVCHWLHKRPELPLKPSVLWRIDAQLAACDRNFSFSFFFFFYWCPFGFRGFWILKDVRSSIMLNSDETLSKDGVWLLCCRQLDLLHIHPRLRWWPVS